MKNSVGEKYFQISYIAKIKQKTGALFLLEFKTISNH
jgi:hypothetical protein